VFPLFLFPSASSGILTGTFSLPGGPQGQIYQELMASQLYFNVFVNPFGLASSTQGKVSNFALSGTPDIRGQIVPTPEPASDALLGAGLVALGYTARRRAGRVRNDTTTPGSRIFHPSPVDRSAS